MGQTDLAVRLLVERHLADLLPGLLGRGRVRVLAVERTELKLVERQTDHVVRASVDGVESILHIELQTWHEDSLPARMLAYHALLRHRHHPLPVRSMVVYLMHEAPAAPIPTGITPQDGDPQVRFTYDLFCPWERPITAREVRRTPALAPIATLTPGIDQHDLPAIRQAIETADLPAAARGDLLAITYIIAGRRFPADLLTSCMRSEAMKESATYREILSEGEAIGRAEGETIGRAEGEAIGLRRAILDLVEARLGDLPDRLETRLAPMDADALRALHNRLARASSTDELRKILPP